MEKASGSWDSRSWCDSYQQGSHGVRFSGSHAQKIQTLYQKRLTIETAFGSIRETRARPRTVTSGCCSFS